MLNKNYDKANINYFRYSNSILVYIYICYHLGFFPYQEYTGHNSNYYLNILSKCNDKAGIVLKNRDRNSGICINYQLGYHNIHLDKDTIHRLLLIGLLYYSRIGLHTMYMNIYQVLCNFYN
jgi:hypothetical protein